jgi:hypothetical protein
VYKGQKVHLFLKLIYENYVSGKYKRKKNK